MLKRLVIAILMTSLIAPSVPAQESNASLMRLAEESGRAFVNGDFNRLVDLTYPRLVVLLGGRAKMLAFLERETAQMKTEGSEMISAMPGDPIQMTTIRKEVYAVVPLTIKIRVPEGILVGKSYMIGISPDRGKSWTFVTADKLDVRRMRVLFPSAVGRLKIPPPEPPTLSPEH